MIIPSTTSTTSKIRGVGNVVVVVFHYVVVNIVVLTDHTVFKLIHLNKLEIWRCGSQSFVVIPQIGLMKSSLFVMSPRFYFYWIMRVNMGMSILKEEWYHHQENQKFHKNSNGEVLISKLPMNLDKSPRLSLPLLQTSHQDILPTSVESSVDLLLEE